PGVDYSAREKDHEFLPPVTPHAVNVARDMLEQLRELREHDVANLVTVLVVHPLEVIDVEHDEGERLVQASRVLEHLIEALIQMAAIVESRERVRDRQLVDLVLQHLDAER